MKHPFRERERETGERNWRESNWREREENNEEKRQETSQLWNPFHHLIYHHTHSSIIASTSWVEHRNNSFEDFFLLNLVFDSSTRFHLTFSSFISLSGRSFGDCFLSFSSLFQSEASVYAQWNGLFEEERGRRQKDAFLAHFHSI